MESGVEKTERLHPMMRLEISSGDLQPPHMRGIKEFGLGSIACIDGDGCGDERNVQGQGSVVLCIRSSAMTLSIQDVERSGRHDFPRQRWTERPGSVTRRTIEYNYVCHSDGGTQVNCVNSGEYVQIATVSRGTGSVSTIHFDQSQVLRG